MRRAHRPGMSYFTVGMLALVVTSVAVYLGFSKAIPFRSHFEVKGVFATSNNLTPGSAVRIAGVNVGKVTGVEHASDGGPETIVTMRINKSGRPLHKDTRLSIRPRIFLEGNFFVDVSPGTPSAPELGDGDVIPVNQTHAPVQLDQILTALQTDTREDLKTLLREYSKALDGKGADGFNKSLPYWEPAYRDSSIVADASLGLLEHDLSEYVKESAVVASALDRNPEQLKSLITDFFLTARAFAREGDNLQAAVAELPRTLRVAYPALGSLNKALPSLRNLARDLRPGVENSEAAIDAATPFVRELRGLVSKPELRGLLSDLRPTVPSLAKLTDATVPLYQQVRRASSCQNEVILPWTKDKIPDAQFPAEGPVYQESVKPLPGLAGESRSTDGNGQWFRVLVSGGTNLVELQPGLLSSTMFPINGTNPPRPTTRPPLSSTTPCESQVKPDLRSKPGQPPPQHKLDTSTERYKKITSKVREKQVKLLRKYNKRFKLGLDIRSKPLTRDEALEIVRIAAARRAAALKAVKKK